MTRTTTAAVLRAADAPFSLERVMLPEPRAEEVLVRIHAAGMCHSDVSVRLGEWPWPVILGHEGAGVVEAVGERVAGIAPGDHVVLTFDSCGHCRACSSAQPAYCDEFGARNMAPRPAGRPLATTLDGEELASRWFAQSSFAGYAIATARNTVVIDHDVPLEIAGPLGCGVQTGAGAILNVLRPEPGDSVAVFGTGGVGLSAILAARLAGASRIVAIEPHAPRREFALRFGATEAFAPMDEAEVRAVVGEVDHALDTTGQTDAIRSALSVLRTRGHLGVLAWRSIRPVVGPRDLLMRGITMTGIMEGSVEPNEFIPRLIELWRQGLFPFDQMLTSFPLHEINIAEAAMTSGEVVKPVLLPED
jgi:aryl-alcohol dehydrogenase